jgi:hypothetical protein
VQASTLNFSDVATLNRVYLDANPPKIESIELKNLTLENLWGSLKKLESSTVFSDSEVLEYSGYTLDSSNSSTLASQDTARGDPLYLPSSIEGKFAKEGDRITLVITVSDDNIDETATLNVDLGDFGLGSVTSASTTKVSDTQIKFEWEITVGSVSEGSAFAVFDIEDEYGNNLNERIQSAEVAEIDNTALVDTSISSYSTKDSMNTYNAKAPYSGEAYRYFNSDYRLAYSSSSDARAYLILFRQDGTESDAGSSSVDFQNVDSGGTSIYYGAAKSSEDFSFEDISTGNYDGKYEVKRILSIDKAGNISNTNGDSIFYGSSIETENELAYILNSNISVLASSSSINEGEYFVDTMAPQGVEGKIIKVSDADPSLDSYLGLSGELPFKYGDILKLTLTATDYNIAQAADQSIVSVGSTSLNASASLTLTDSATPPWETAMFEVDNSSDSIDDHNFYDATVVDKAGNSSPADIIGTLSNITPALVSINLYENFWSNWKNETTEVSGDSSLQADNSGDTYGFSKGSKSSNAPRPLFALNFSGDLSTVAYLKLTVNGTEHFEAYTPTTYDISITDVDAGIYLTPNTKNIVSAISYSAAGKPAATLDTSYIVADTEVNSSSTAQLTKSADYIASTEKYEFELDFSSILELAGLKGYKVKSVKTNVNGETISSSPMIDYPSGDNSLGSDYDGHMGLSTTPFTTLTGANIKRTVSISKDDLLPGSRSTLVVSLIDALGSQKDIDFNFLLPEPSVKLKAKTIDSRKIRESAVKVVGESYSDKGFEVKTLEDTGE